MNKVIDNIKSRRSIRKYKDRAVSKAVIKQIIEAGRYAPSSHNSQPWRFIVITDRKLIRELAEMMKGFYKKVLKLAPLFSFKKGMKYLKDGAEKRVNSEKDLFFYDAPVLILICAKAKGFAMVDCACAAQNMMLMARSLGIGSCWIGFADRTFEFSNKMRKKAHIPKGLKVMATLVFGYPMVFPGIVPRKKEADVVEWVN